jgi:hypothetical protein
LETFTAPKQIVNNAGFREQRRRCLAGLCDTMIDRSLVAIVNQFNALPFCFTLQCCHGHFVLPGEQNPSTLDSLPTLETHPSVLYRIAYLAFCIDNCKKGRCLLTDLETLVNIDPQYIQFGSADWFWERQINSFVLQVEPERCQFHDSVTLDYREALHVERIRNAFFARLETVLQAATSK